MSVLMHLKGELSRKALRYAEAWVARAAQSGFPGELDRAWEELSKAAVAYAQALAEERADLESLPSVISTALEPERQGQSRQRR
jgi:hypothetical protein